MKLICISLTTVPLKVVWNSEDSGLSCCGFYLIIVTKVNVFVRKKFREYLPIQTGKGFSLKLKGKCMLLV